MRRRHAAAISSSALVFVLAAVASACGDDDVPAATPAGTDGGIDSGQDGNATVPLCQDGKPTSAYPPGPYEMSLTSTLPQGLVFPGPDGDVAIDSFYEPCAEKSRILVVRSTAAWCGTCLWHLENDKK